MEKQTLKFQTMSDLAQFSKTLLAGYLMNTNKLTLTGRFSSPEIELALINHKAFVIDTSDKVFTY